MQLNNFLLEPTQQASRKASGLYLMCTSVQYYYLYFIPAWSSPRLGICWPYDWSWSLQGEYPPEFWVSTKIHIFPHLILHPLLRSVG